MCLTFIVRLLEYNNLKISQKYSLSVLFYLKKCYFLYKDLTTLEVILKIIHNVSY